MKLIHGLLHYDIPWKLPDVYIFTGNSVIKNNGAIVMGRGAAKQVRDTYPRIDIALGHRIAKSPDIHVHIYKLNGKQFIGWFKVKNHWQQPADLTLIQRSTNELIKIATDYPIHTYHMNFPGVGNGRLSDKSVMPIIKALPDNVLIYR